MIDEAPANNGKIAPDSVPPPARAANYRLSAGEGNTTAPLRS